MNYKLILALVIFLLARYRLKSQVICIDSVFTAKYFGDNWYYFDEFIQVNLKDAGTRVGLAVSDSIDKDGIPIQNGYIVIGLDKFGIISFSKKWRIEKGSIYPQEFIELNNGDILFSGRLTKKGHYSFLGRMDGNGNIKWINCYKDYSLSVRADMMQEDPNGNLLIPGRSGNDLVLIKIGPNGEELWASLYKMNESLEYSHSFTASTLISDSLAYIFRIDYFPSDIFGKHSGSSLYIMKILHQTGNLIKSQLYSFSGNGELFQANSIIEENRIAIYGSGISNSIPFIYKIELDNNFNILKTEKVNGPAGNRIKLRYISTTPFSKQVLGTMLENSKENAYFFSATRDLDFLFQRKMKLKPGFEKIQLIERAHGRENLYLSYRNDVKPYFEVHDFSTSNLLNSDCIGKNTFMLFKPGKDPVFTVKDPSVSQFGYNSMQIPMNIDILQTDYQIKQRTICKQQSICDSLKISGPQTICNPEMPQSFHIEMRKDCLKKIAWEIDNSAIEKFTRFDNDSIHVLFKKGWQRGYLKASIASCRIIDSFLVTIPEKLPPLNLGKDTALCRDTITLRTNNDYKTFLWQDGTSADSLKIFSPGVYWLQATDGCGNTFRDTVSITQPDLSFSAGIHHSICLDDSITLKATSGFQNYHWEPLTSIHNADDDEVIVSPEITTRYRVQAEVFPGCVVRDSVYVTVNDCPQSIFFANAFSPNNDGLNDTFHPVIDGKLKNYKLSVYNRNGLLVFQTTDPAQGWNGRYKGELQSPGIYVWTCAYAFNRKKGKQVNGVVMLVH